jgi:mobilome CxxCx(11)CxxC protein
MENKIREKLEQKKFDAYFRIRIHRYNIISLERTLKRIDIVAICCPIAFLALQLAMQSSIFHIMDILIILNFISYILSALLIIVVIYSLIQGYREKLKHHQKCLVEYLSIPREINEILLENKLDCKDAKRILDRIFLIEKDEISLVDISKSIKRRFHREVLLEQYDEALCSKCYSSPLEYKWWMLWNLCPQCGVMMNKSPNDKCDLYHEKIHKNMEVQDE